MRYLPYVCKQDHFHELMLYLQKFRFVERMFSLYFHLGIDNIFHENKKYNFSKKNIHNLGQFRFFKDCTGGGRAVSIRHYVYLVHFQSYRNTPTTYLQLVPIVPTAFQYKIKTPPPFLLILRLFIIIYYKCWDSYQSIESGKMRSN